MLLCTSVVWPIRLPHAELSALSDRLQLFPSAAEDKTYVCVFRKLVVGYSVHTAVHFLFEQVVALVLELGANYKKILRLSYDVIITYDNRKSNLR